MSPFNLTPEVPSQPQIESLAKTSRWGELLRAADRAHETVAAMGVLFSAETTTVETVSPVSPATAAEPSSTDSGEASTTGTTSELDTRRAMVAAAIAEQELQVEQEGLPNAS